jgi:uncharacterized NAD(P)/FAD-binding protein YdhS
MLNTHSTGESRWQSHLRTTMAHPGRTASFGLRGAAPQPAGRAWDAAIIGLGPAGLATLLGLIRHARRPLSLLLVDPAESPGGHAYRRARPEHLLNARAANMSVDPGDSESFSRWLATRLELQPERVAERYAPRALYGEYLDDQRHRAFMLAAESGHRLCRLRRLAADVSEAEGGLQVTLDDGDQRLARHVVLAPGCRDRPWALGALAGGRVAESPWHADYEAAARRCGAGTALIAGGGLSAVDAALSLASSGWGGPVVIAAPGGRLPAHHIGGHVSAEPVTGTPDVLAGSAREVFAQARALLLTKTGESRDWRDGMHQLRSALPQVWARLNPAHRRRLLRHAAGIWNRHRHRIAPDAVARIEALQRSGQLRVEPWRVLGVREERGVLTVAVRERGRGQRSVTADYLINAAGLDLAPGAHPLVANMLDRGLVAPSPTGLGLAVEPVGTAVARLSKVSSVHAVGSLLVGERLESTAVLELVAQADLTAQEIASVLGRRATAGDPVGARAAETSLPEPLFATD